MASDDIFDVIKNLVSAPKTLHSLDEILTALRPCGIKNLAYLVLNLPSSVNNDRPLLAMTYGLEWQKRYAQQSYTDVDPILKAGITGILPIDWDDIDKGDPLIRQFFGEAQELDVGSRGLSIPIRGKHGEFALFTVTTEIGEREWQAEKRRIMADLMLLSWRFHSDVIDRNIVEPKKATLTRREGSCLRLKALGKSDQDVADILTISKSTVRFHIESARQRLGANNVIQAVAKAVSLGLINLVVEPESLIRK